MSSSKTEAIHDEEKTIHFLKCNLEDADDHEDFEDEEEDNINSD